MPRTYDPKCYALAQEFLRDKPTDTDAVYRHKCGLLAAEIQEAIDAWFKENPDLQMR